MNTQKVDIKLNNSMQVEIKTAEANLNRTIDTIKRLQSSSDKTSFVEKQLEKLQYVQADIENTIKILKNNPSEYEAPTRLKKENTKRNKGVVKQARPLARLPYVPHKFTPGGPASESFMQKETDRYFRLVDSIPDFIKANLENMPANKGYVWRGLYNFGKKPPEHNATSQIFFEKLKGGVLRIHEETRHEKTIYEKVGSERKRLISSEKRVWLVPR